ncbi:MAG: copper resistance protein CopC [Paludibacterium sp.]|uniref:copper resistance protein CopC n=1 Tax=Paludibacterium sp. TaxID=1917523 RepID=UPI0025E1DB48|nr:copper resistance protein CopC [Paludibacterium sp.]MBV8049270.1 copper resistance protein CopC [Paludibacterium sp.]MBV8648284.1 copper resistance protein CopC [Paludibacterium sp.]
MPRSLLCRLGAAALLLVAYQTAWAHAHPAAMTPAANSTVAAPKEVRMRFTEPLEPALSALELDDAQGKKIGNAPSAVDTPDSMRLPLPPLAAGGYMVKWVAVAKDGHRTHGSYIFHVQ